MVIKVREIPILLDYGDLPFSPAWVGELVPRSLPRGWKVVKVNLDGVAYYDATGLAVIVSGGIELDGRRWWHVSTSRANRLPSYDDQKTVKRLFCGDEREAYSVWPRASRHISIHRWCLHLWCPVDGPVLPDFARGGRSI